MNKFEENRSLEEELVPVLSDKISDLTVEDLINVIFYAMNLQAEYRSNCAKAKRMIVHPSRDAEIIDHISKNPGICKTELRVLRSSLGINASVLTRSIDNLVASGHLAMEKVGLKHIYTATGKEYAP